MVTKINYFTENGRNILKCKDRVYVRENGESGVYSLADGVNSYEKSGIGARAIQKVLADEWEKDPDGFFEIPLSEVRKRFVEIVHEVIYNLSKETEEAENYASTLLILFVSRTRGKFRWVHIGDGIILKENCWGEKSIVSYEHNGMTPQYTFTTISQPLCRYLRVGEGNMNLVRRFVLFTDGAILPFYKDREVTEYGNEVLDRGVDALYSVLRNLRLKDDYSVLELVIG